MKHALYGILAVGSLVCALVLGLMFKSLTAVDTIEPPPGHDETALEADYLEYLETLPPEDRTALATIRPWRPYRVGARTVRIVGVYHGPDGIFVEVADIVTSEVLPDVAIGSLAPVHP